MCHVICHGSYPVNSDAAGGCQHDLVSIALEVCFVACTIMVCALRGLNCVADAAATECFKQKAHACAYVYTLFRCRRLNKPEND